VAVPYDIEFDAREPLPESLLPPGGLVALVERVLADAEVEDGAGLTLLLADDDLLRALNEAYRGVDAPTDVLAFSAQEMADDDESDPFFELEEAVAATGSWTAEAARYLGDIAVSVERAREQAAEAEISTKEESYLGAHIHASGAHEHEFG
jgi:probable rRNA maturation factor